MNACEGNNRQKSEGLRHFLWFLPTTPSDSISPCLLHDWRKIKGHWSLSPVIQVGGWFNFFLAIYDVTLFLKKGTIQSNLTLSSQKDRDKKNTFQIIWRDAQRTMVHVSLEVNYTNVEILLSINALQKGWHDNKLHTTGLKKTKVPFPIAS